MESWADTHYELLDAVSDGRTVTWEGAHFFTLGAEGLIRAVWALGDTFAKARQLGALPGS